MSDFLVKGGSTAKLGRVDGDLKVGRNVTITAESGGKVVVAGGAYFEGQVRINCDLECQTMGVEGSGYGPGGDVRVRGNLKVIGKADLNATVRVDGSTVCDDLDVGGHFESESLTSRRARVGGHMKISGRLEAAQVDVGGHLTVFDSVKITDLRVGGHVEVGGGSISGEIRVRGHFKTTKKLDYGKLKVFGNTVFPAGCTGESLTAIGRVEFEGDTSCKALDVSGSAWVRGNCAADQVEVKGRMEVRGSLTSKKLDVLGTTSAGGQVTSDEIRVGGRLEADKVLANHSIQVAGELCTTRGAKSSAVVIGRGSRFAGPIVADEVEIGKELAFAQGVLDRLSPERLSTIGRMTRVDDVHARAVKMWHYSRAKKIFAERVEMGEGTIADKIEYTKELALPRNYHVEEQATKVERLPDPPL